jgi:hypothetical protein
MLGLCPASPAHAADDKAESVSEGDKRRAQELYDAAMKSFDQDDYESALRAFQDSYKAVKSPNSHFMIARSLARLGRNVEAYKELTAVIDECEARGSRYADTEQAAYAKRQEVTPRIALLTVTMGNAPKGTQVVVGEDKLTAGDIGKQLAVLPGETKVVAVTPDGKKHTQAVTIRTGESGTVDLDIPGEKKKEPKRSEPPFDETAYTKYSVELGLHFAGETVPPNDTDSRGAGPGGRLYFNVLPKGLIADVVDSFAIGAGVDASLTSKNQDGTARSHVLVPVTAQWNFWLTDRFSLFLEPGVSLVLGAGTHVQPVIYAGARYALGSSFALTGKAGIPDATVGVAFLF